MHKIATGTAKAPATCGELIQGNIGGVDFLVTCPINIFSTVTVDLYPIGKITADGAFPPNSSLPKVEAAVMKTLAQLSMQHLGAEISVDSRIPHGKGMASSTADIAAACAATAAALELPLTPTEIADIALSIEPTDGLMFPGIVLFDHLHGKHIRGLGSSPKSEVVVVDLGGMVDTLAFNKDERLAFYNRSKEKAVHLALTKLEKALNAGDISLMGEAATESALAHQTVLYKPELNDLLDICKTFGGIGINIAHSGTVVGLLFKPGRIKHGEPMAALRNRGYHILCRTELVDGGIQILQERDGEKTWTPLTTSMVETCGKLRKNTV